MEEEDTSEDEGLSVKGLMALISDSPDGNHNMCDTDTSQVVQEWSQNLEHTWFLDSGCSRHMIGFKSLLTYFAEKDGPMVVFDDNNERDLMGVGAFECRALKSKDLFNVKDLKENFYLL